MPTIGHIGGLDVMIFRNDHDPPHFHVIGAEFSAKFTIAARQLLSSSGRIRRGDVRDIEAWGQRHQAALYLNWQLARAGNLLRNPGLTMLYQIRDAIPHPDQTVTITWSDGATFTVDLQPYIDRGGLFAPLRRPDYFVQYMSVLRGGIGLTWPNEVDFSADGLRRDAFPKEPSGEYDQLDVGLSDG